MHLYEVIRRPLVTEKNTIMQEQGRYVFEVARTATKPQVKQAVELAFKVKVDKVNVVVVPGKKKRMGRRETQASDTKKAIVTLEPGFKITLFEGV
jgi:large subunit ribosomal protein L23